MLGRKWSGFQRGVVLGSVAYAAVFVVMLIVHPGSERFYAAFFNTYQIIPPLFAGVCGVAFARRAGYLPLTRRVGWFCVGAGCLSFVVGQATWTYYESIRGIEAPFPSLADVGYIGAYPFLITGVILLFGSMHVAGRTRLLLDSAIAASSVGVLSWYFLIQRIWEQSDLSLVGKLITVAYPLGDLTSLFGAFVLFSSVTSDRIRRRSLAFLASGLLLLTFGDTTFTYMTLHNTYKTGGWSDWAWSFGWMLIGYAALVQLWWGAPGAGAQEEQAVGQQHGSRSLYRILAPYTAVASAFLVIALHDYSLDGVVSNSVVIEGLFLILLVILRQVFTLAENQHLTSQLRAFNENLEQIVARRTEQLTSLHQLTKAVNNTLQVDQVLAAAAEHTRQALRADAVALWLLESDPSDSGRFPRIHLHEGLRDKPEVFRFLREQPMSDHVQMRTLPLAPGAGTGGVTFLQAPLRWQGRPIGMVGVLRWDGGFGPTEPEVLESIGLEVGTALENARLYGAAVEAADRDPVTGLFNHRAIHQRLDRQFQQARLGGRALSVIMMDLNNFKLFNDTYGHPVGDQVLKRVGGALEAECQERDILGRYGGDEFIILLPDTDVEGAKAVAQRLRERMMREGFHRAGEERTIPISLSFGIAAFPNDGANRHELLAIADANLYAAKNSEEGIIGTTETQRTNRELRSEGSFGVLDALVTAVDNKDRYTRRHSEDVTEYALWIAEELGMSEETMRVIRVGGLLHDIGKIGVPDEILRKPGRLTAEEFDVMKRHPELGALIVGGIPGMEPILDAVRYHHERWDGNGYPDRLAGENIPLLGRMLAVADAFSAMTTDRPYRRGMEWDAALEEVRAHTGSQFDPAMARAFLAAAARRRAATYPGIFGATDALPKAA